MLFVIKSLFTFSLLQMTNILLQMTLPMIQKNFCVVNLDFIWMVVNLFEENKLLQDFLQPSILCNLISN